MTGTKFLFAQVSCFCRVPANYFSSPITDFGRLSAEFTRSRVDRFILQASGVGLDPNAQRCNASQIATHRHDHHGGYVPELLNTKRAVSARRFCRDPDRGLRRKNYSRFTVRIRWSRRRDRAAAKTRREISGQKGSEAVRLPSPRTHSRKWSGMVIPVAGICGGAGAPSLCEGSWSERRDLNSGPPVPQTVRPEASYARSTLALADLRRPVRDRVRDFLTGGI